MIESCGNSSGLGEGSEFKSDLIGGSNLLCLIHAAFGQLLPSVGVIWPHPHHPIGLSFSTCIIVLAWRAFGVSVGLAYSGHPRYFVIGSWPPPSRCHPHHCLIYHKGISFVYTLCQRHDRKSSRAAV